MLDLLSTLAYDPFYSEVPAFFGMSLEELFACKHPTAWQQFERGVIDESRFLDSFFADGRRYDAEGMVDCMRSAYRWLDGMEELVSDLHRGGARLYALSNYPVWYRHIDQQLGLSRFMTFELVSCYSGWRKPAYGSFMHAAATLGVEPESLVFLDDRQDNCDAARLVGLDAIRFAGHESARGELKRRGLLPA